MRKIFNVICIILFMTLTVIPTSSSQISDEEIIKSNLISMWAAIEKGDINKYAEYIHPDFTSFGENDTYLAEGKDLEVQKISNWLKKAVDVHTEMHQPSITVKGNTAWITYYWSDWGEEDGKSFSSRGKSTRIFVRKNGKWLCIHGHYTAVQ